MGMKNFKTRGSRKHFQIVVIDKTFTSIYFVIANTVIGVIAVIAVIVKIYQHLFWLK